MKINQNAKEAAEKIAASDLRMAEIRGEAERSAKVQRQLFEELALPLFHRERLRRRIVRISCGLPHASPHRCHHQIMGK